MRPHEVSWRVPCSVFLLEFTISATRLKPQLAEGITMSNYSRYQQNIIRKYYENRDGIALQRVQELVTELYLSEGKKREKHWQSLATHLEKLGVHKSQIEHLRKQDNPELVANLVKSLMSQEGGTP
jgi:hypothetical protein